MIAILTVVMEVTKISAPSQKILTGFFEEKKTRYLFIIKKQGSTL